MPSIMKTTKQKSSAAAVVEALRSSSRVLITSHVSPDGDAVGSVLALEALARALGVKSVTVALHDPVPRVYEWLPGSGYILPPAKVKGPFDLVLLADANALERSGSLTEYAGKGTRVAIVDHHLVETVQANVHFIDPVYAATGEMVAELFELAGLPLTREVAECIYVALSTDTGNFRYANTTARSHRIAARLIEAGIDVRDITSRVIDTMSLGKFRLLRRLLDRAQFSDNGRIAHASIPLMDLKETGALSEPTILASNSWRPGKRAKAETAAASTKRPSKMPPTILMPSLVFPSSATNLAGAISSVKPKAAKILPDKAAGSTDKLAACKARSNKVFLATLASTP